MSSTVDGAGGPGKVRGGGTSRTLRSWLGDRWRQAVAAVLVLLLVLGPPAVLVAVGAIGTWDREPTAQCLLPVVSSRSDQVLAADPDARVSLQSAAERGVSLALGRDGMLSRDELPLRVSEVLTALEPPPATRSRGGGTLVLPVRLGPTKRADGAELEVAQAVSAPVGVDGVVVGRVVWSRSTDDAQLFVCVSRDQLSDPRAGTYTGVLRVDDPRAVAFELPVTVTLAYGAWWNVAAVCWLAAVAGVAVSFLARERRPEPPARPSRTSSAGPSVTGGSSPSRGWGPGRRPSGPGTSSRRPGAAPPPSCSPSWERCSVRPSPRAAPSRWRPRPGDDAAIGSVVTVPPDPSCATLGGWPTPSSPRTGATSSSAAGCGAGATRGWTPTSGPG